MKSERMYDPYRNQRMKTNLEAQKQMISHLTVPLLTRKKSQQMKTAELGTFRQHYVPAERMLISGRGLAQ